MRRWAVVVLVVALAATTGGCRKGSESSAPSSTTSTVPPEIRVTVASSAVESMRAEPVEFPGEARDAVASTLNSWIDVGVVDPLLSGQPPVGLDAAFTPVAVARLVPGSPDYASMLSDGGATAAVQPETATAALTGLADEGGALQLVTASVEVAFVQVTGVDQVRVVRRGEVVLVPVGGGGWLIDSYDMVTTRDTVA